MDGGDGIRRDGGCYSIARGAMPRAPVIAARGNDDVVDVEFEDVKK